MNRLVVTYLRDTWGLLRSPTALQTSFVTAGTLSSAILRFGVMVLLAKVLVGPEDFGALIVFVALMDIAAVACDCGISIVLVRFVAANPERRPTPILLRCLGIKAVLSGAVVAILGVIYPLFTSYSKISAEYVLFYPIAGIAAIFVSLNTFLMGVSQARRRYGYYAVQAALANGLRFAAILLLSILGMRGIWILAGVFFAAPLAATLGSVCFMWASLRGTLRLEPTQIATKELLSFLVPVALLQVIVVAITRADVMMLQAMATMDVVGHYGLAYQVAYVFPLLSGALFTVLLPKVSAMRRAEDLARYRSRVIHVYPAVLGCGVVAMVVVPYLVYVIFGPPYAGALPILRLTILNFALGSIFNPLALIYYSLGRPYVLVGIHLAQLVLLVPLNLVLIPIFLGMGPVLSLLLVTALATTAMVYMSKRAVSSIRDRDNGVVLPIIGGKPYA